MKLNKNNGLGFSATGVIVFCLLLFASNVLGQSESKEPSDFSALKKLSFEELQLKTQANRDLWGLGTSDRWDLEQAKGDLIFTFSDGIKAVAPAQIIGTYNSKDGTWLWAWANSSINDALKKDALKLRAYGEKHGIEQLTKPKWAATEEEAWLMTAVAAKLFGAQGAYRGPSGTTLFVFMTFGEVSLSKNK